MGMRGALARPGLSPVCWGIRDELTHWLPNLLSQELNLLPPALSPGHSAPPGPLSQAPPPAPLAPPVTGACPHPSQQGSGPVDPTPTSLLPRPLFTQPHSQSINLTLRFYLRTKVGATWVSVPALPLLLPPPSSLRSRPTSSLSDNLLTGPQPQVSPLPLHSPHSRRREFSELSALPRYPSGTLWGSLSP